MEKEGTGSEQAGFGRVVLEGVAIIGVAVSTSATIRGMKRAVINRSADLVATAVAEVRGERTEGPFHELARAVLGVIDRVKGQTHDESTDT